MSDNMPSGNLTERLMRLEESSRHVAHETNNIRQRLDVLERPMREALEEMRRNMAVMQASLSERETRRDQQFAEIRGDIAQVKDQVKSDVSDLKGRMVTQTEFFGPKWLIYGFVSIALTAMVGALVGTVIVK